MMNIKIKRNENTAIQWLSSAHLICDIYGGFLNPIMPFIAANLGFTMATATVIISIAQICSNMLQPIFGFFADNLNKRLFIFWGLILASIFIPLTASATNLTMLTFFMILGCLGGSFFHPQSTGFVNTFSKHNCANNMGLFIACGSFGFAIGPLLAAYITQFAGLNKVSYTSIVGLIIALLMFLFVPKLSDKTKKEQHKNFNKSFKDIFSNTQMKLLMIIAIMKAFVTNSFCILLPFLWKDMGKEPFYIGSAIFLFVFMGAVASYLSPYVEKIVGSKPIIYFSMYATLPMIILFANIYNTHQILSVIAFSLIGFTTNLAQPVIMVWAQNTLPEYKSIVAGFINGFCWGIVALCLSILGCFAQKYGIINILIFIAIVPAICSYFVKFLKPQTN